MIAKVVSLNHRDWDVHLPFVLAAYRASVSESTGFTPNRLFLGRELCLPIDLVLGDSLVLPDPLGINDFAWSQVERIQVDFEQARQFSQKQAISRSHRYDLRVKAISFQPGDLAWYFCPRKKVGLKDKWVRMYTGPYQIEECLSPVLYRIRKTPKSQAKNVHVDKLKKFVGDNRNFPKDNSPSDWADFEGDQPLDPSSLRPQRKIIKPARFRD